MGYSLARGSVRRALMSLELTVVHAFLLLEYTTEFQTSEPVYRLLLVLHALWQYRESYRGGFVLVTDNWTIHSPPKASSLRAGGVGEGE